MEEEILPGFHIYHHPTEETWVVAYCDVANDEVSALGWPDGTAKLSDCTVVQRFGPREVIETYDRLQAAGAHRRAIRAKQLHGEWVENMRQVIASVDSARKTGDWNGVSDADVKKAGA